MADEQPGTSDISKSSHIVTAGGNIVKTQLLPSADDTGSLIAADPNHATARVVDHKAERALCRKFDFRLLPVLSLMCELGHFSSLNSTDQFE
jgi:hypothetical protein